MVVANKSEKNRINHITLYTLHKDLISIFICEINRKFSIFKIYS